MKEILTIPKELQKTYGQEYNWLRENGLKHIEKLGSRLWTDYNTHDPGITILELLCWVITDLGYRNSLPVEDILATEENNLQNMHRQFLSALNIFPSAPVTADDYRKLFMRIDGVKNAWMQKASQPVIAKYKPQPVALRYATENEAVKDGEEIKFELNGLYNILLDIEESHLSKKDEIIKAVKQIYQHFRNLCEDLVAVDHVPTQEIVICADVELLPKADPEETWARIVFAVEEYLSPSVNFYSLQQMLDKRISSDEIFDGPVFEYATLPITTSTSSDQLFAKKGFIDHKEIKASSLRTEVRLSDIMRIIQQLEGVKLIRSIAFGFCGCDETDMLLINKAVDKNNWLLCVKEGHKPKLCLTNSVINFHKDVIPIDLKELDAKIRLQELKNLHKKKQEAAFTEDLPMPLGKYRDIESYNTLQNHLPETYGIGRTGLPDSASTERKALAKQLKAYLLFFDQVLANYFSQLVHVKDLLSVDNTLKQTYFSNVVKGIKEVEEAERNPADEDNNKKNVFTGYNNWKQTVEKIVTKSGLDNYVERKNKFLDHLLARFAEQFSEYVFLLHRIYGADYDQAIIRQKINFYKDYHNMSTFRADALDYFNSKTASEKELNVSGMERRISRMLGFNHYKRKKFSQLPYFIFKVPPATNLSPYSWAIDMEGVTVLKGTELSRKKADAYEEMGLATILGCEREHYKTVLSADNSKVSFKIINTAGEDVAYSSGDFTTSQAEIDAGVFPAAEQQIDQLISYFMEEFRLEGMYVVEHMILRPQYDPGNLSPSSFMPVCIDVNGNHCRPTDPYSFRIAVILPGYTMRMRNKDFRRFAERLIRMETPAHILPRICFIGEAQMKEFEDTYYLWLETRINSTDPMQQVPEALNKKLVDVLENLFTVYNEGTLGDCDDDTDEDNPVILGQTNLGTL